jgi:hypothetical protein
VPIRPHDGGVRQQHPDGSLPGQLPDDCDRPRFRVQTREHFNYPDKTPLSNLWLTDPEGSGLKVEKFGGSTGTLGEILV